MNKNWFYSVPVKLKYKINPFWMKKTHRVQVVQKKFVHEIIEI